ncbi:hypothetical protein Mycsm_07091 (plasmid) [Mycobacterium sp. JS623]|uniref:hypothetical protein n=1 Tax=Mycobacterium sp. JS623 TaxID=212767 RepID=UPI0002A59FBF|nr:hypothetical protein [Mycobacterium sp. JS623]AGB27188.1 hypothetical protein Mycsm_07091 [Mycobacterium sp. JS623]
MANRYNYVHTDAKGALYQGLPAVEARTEWGTTEIEESHALGLFNAGGDGLIIDGKPEDLLQFVDLLHAHAHTVFDRASH